MSRHNEDHAQILEDRFDDFSKEFKLLLKDYKKKSKRLDKIIKLSDKQQFDMIKLNEQLDLYKNHLEKIVDEKTQELKELNRNLEQRVKEEVEANRQKDQQLYDQAKFVQLGELIGNIAHQWRQPLNAISTSVSGIQTMRELGIYDNDDEDKALGVIFERTQYLSGVINNFREFIDQAHEQEDAIVQEIIHSTADIVLASLDNDTISLILDIPENSITISTIPSDLSQVLLSIIKNAKDALLKSSKDEDKVIKVSLEDISDEVIIKVSDNADGIEDDVLPKIFDPYFTTKHQAQGTGLGLYLSKKTLEEKLNGILVVESTSKDGTIFTIKLKK